MRRAGGNRDSMAAQGHNHSPKQMRELARKPHPGRRNPAPIPLHMPKPPTDGPAGRYYGGIARGLINDLGGRENVPTALREMVSNFAGVCTLLREQNYKIAQGKGDDVAVADYAVLVNRLVKLCSRIGLRRIPKQIPSLEFVSQRPETPGRGRAPRERRD